MSRRPLRPRPRDYTPDFVVFGQQQHLRWALPPRGSEDDLRLARQQHAVAWRLRGLGDPRALRRIAAAAGVARSTMSDYMWGRRWMSPQALAATTLYMASRIPAETRRH